MIVLFALPMSSELPSTQPSGHSPIIKQRKIIIELDFMHVYYSYAIYNYISVQSLFHKCHNVHHILLYGFLYDFED